MTVVRRAARLSNPLPSPDMFSLAPAPSAETVIKAQSTKMYLENHYNDIVKQTKERKTRLNIVKERLNCSSLDSKQQQEVYRNFTKEETNYSRWSRIKLKKERFNKIKLIGVGGFGCVWLVQDALTSELYALKVLRKADILRRDQVVHVKTERDILAYENPWFVDLHAAFQDDNCLYLVLEYVCGGDLMTALIKKGKFTESVTRFFIGEVLMAVNSVHKLDFIHRDVKPDNILITKNGHIKLTDFGLSTNYTKNDNKLAELSEKIHDIMVAPHTGECYHARGNEIGSVDYTAPEILRGDTPTTASDIWSIGIMMYEMLFGHPPFIGRNVNETAYLVVNYSRTLVYPKSSNVSPAAYDLLHHLLCEPDDRYTYEQITSHQFFSSFNFDDFKANYPPFVPVIRYPADTCHFDDFHLTEEQYADQLPNKELSKFAFLNFSFKHRPKNRTLASEVFV